ncbi:hypothetical protein AWZ03_007497 [Drosophila navojoa]|uniref:Uncharacterized protein n=1 Tax=Drosophila navojoa TaxID=7232 RepID=A0A484BBC9_DRONA|nr:hypothetical protein AWZ03_007497 [Drosophila navojoa]
MPKSGIKWAQVNTVFGVFKRLAQLAKVSVVILAAERAELFVQETRVPIHHRNNNKNKSNYNKSRTNRIRIKQHQHQHPASTL